MKKLVAILIFAASLAQAQTPQMFRDWQAVAGSRAVASAPVVADTYTPQASNYIAFWYRFTDFTNALGNFTDSSGKGNMGNNDGGLTFLSSPPSVESLDGTKYGTCVTNNPYFADGCSAVVFSCWIKLITNAHTYGGVVVAEGLTGPLGILKEDTVYYFAQTKATVFGEAISFGSNIVTDVGTWHWILGQWSRYFPDTNDRGMETYFDGKLIAHAQYTGPNQNIQWTSGLLRMLWRDKYGDERKIHGSIDEVTCWTNTVLTSNQVWQQWLDMPRGLYGR